MFNFSLKLCKEKNAYLHCIYPGLLELQYKLAFAFEYLLH